MNEQKLEPYAFELLNPERAEDFFNLIANNRSRLEDTFSGTVARMQTLESAREYCVFIEERMREKLYFPFMITDTGSGEYVGLIDVKSIDWSVPKAEIGYFIDERHARQGIVSEFLAKVIDKIVKEHGFQKLICRVSPDNKASARVAIKSGFALEGTLRSDYRTFSGRLLDTNYYGRIFSADG